MAPVSGRDDSGSYPAERALAGAVTDRLGASGASVDLEWFAAPASPSAPPMMLAALRLGCAALVAAGHPGWAIALAAGSLLAELARLDGRDPAAAVLRSLPLAGGRACNVVARIGPGEPDDDPPLLVAARLGPPPPPRAWTVRAAVASLVLVLAGVLAALGSAPAARTLAAAGGLEAVLAIALHVRRELGPRPSTDRSALAALTAVAALSSGKPLVRPVWLVAAGASAAGPQGLEAVRRAHPALARTGWLISLDTLAGEDLALVDAAPGIRRRTAHAVLVRTVVGAAIETGDVVEPVPDGGSADQSWALARRMQAVTLTAGRAGDEGAAAARAARIVVRVAQTSL